MNLDYTCLHTPIGPLHVAAGPRGLCALAFDDRWDDERAFVARRFGDVGYQPAPVAAAAALTAYFEGDLTAIDTIEVDAGGTPFQQRVWTELRHVPAGTSASYLDIARAIGQPSATRAVGAANGRNPVAIVVPCHRVIGASGKLTGYGGGLDKKQWLLRHERCPGFVM